MGLLYLENGRWSYCCRLVLLYKNTCNVGLLQHVSLYLRSNTCFPTQRLAKGYQEMRQHSITCNTIKIETLSIPTQPLGKWFLGYREHDQD